MPKAVLSLVGFVKIIEALRKSAAGDLFFRGHTRSAYEAIPSVYRNPGHLDNEHHLLNGLISESPREFEADKYTFDRLVRAQHYGVPTRLLDISHNPLMSLFFACEGEDDRRGQVIVFETTRDSAKYFSSDSVSLKANLANLKKSEKEALSVELLEASRANFNYPMRRRFSSLSSRRTALPDAYSKFLIEFNDRPTVRRLVQFVKEEKPYFENRVDPIDLRSVEVVIPKKANPRILAQSGAFLIFGTLNKLDEATSQNLEYSVIDINPEKKREIRESLAAIGIHSGSVYPELSRAGERIKSKYFSNS